MPASEQAAPWMAPLSPSFLLGLRGEPEGFGSCKQL